MKRGAMSNFFDQAPRIIREAARNPLGLLALVVLALSFLAFTFFHAASELIRSLIFLAMLIGAGLFVTKIFQLASHERMGGQETVGIGTGRSEPAAKARGEHPKSQMLGIRVVASSEDIPPFAIDAMVVEEDTHLVMSADPILKESKESPRSVRKEAEETDPKDPGTVVVKGSNPLRFYAVIHDLSEEPSWREKWISDALGNIFREAESRKVRAIRLPQLGTVHGGLDEFRFTELFKEACQRASFQHLKAIWVNVKHDSDPEIIKKLEKHN